MNNYGKKSIDLKLTNSEYYDFYLYNGGDASEFCNYEICSGDSIVVWYDFNNTDIFKNYPNIDTIKSLVYWTGATNTGYSFKTFGLTGLDNGALVYNKDSGDTKNIELINILTGSTLNIQPNNDGLILTRVTGSTGQFIYPIEYFDDLSPVGGTGLFLGGFYQGYYKIDGSTYEVLPNRVPKAWVADFWLNKSDMFSGYTGTTLNDAYPNNKGFFFYMGTRAENKFWDIFEGNNTGCTLNCTTPSGCTDAVTNFCTELKESQMQIMDPDSGYPIYLDPPQLEIKEIENQFLIYGRAKDSNDRCGHCGEPRDNDAFGKETVCSFTGNSITTAEFVRKKTDFRNQFLIYGRAKDTSSRCGHCGEPRDSDTYGRETVCTYSGDSEIVLELDKNLDVYDNAIGFRITDDGRVGYRALKYTGYCSGDTYITGVTVEEQYSMSGMVKSDEWTRVTVRFIANDRYNSTQLKCLGPRKGKLMFYVNCKLKAVFKNVDEFIARRLQEYKGKQVGVPFNISIGGGSQGLLESMTFDGQDNNDLGLLIEQNFAGSFIGQISQFKFYIEDQTWCDISSGCVMDSAKYGLTTCEVVGLDCFAIVNSITDLNSIPLNIRRSGMIVRVNNSNVYYKLKKDKWVNNLSDWEALNNSLTKYAEKQEPIGVVDGTNKTFELGHIPIPNSDYVYLNGVLQESGQNGSYIISGKTITFNNVIPTGSKILVSYKYN